MQLDLLSSHAVSQLFFVVLQNLLALTLLLVGLAHHAVQDHLASPTADKQLKRCVFILFELEVTSGQFLKEIVDCPSIILIRPVVALLATPTLNDG